MIIKRVVSISLGSSNRDHKVREEILGEEIIIERIGTDGSIKKAKELFKELDGKVDAFGLGGIDLYLKIKDNQYILKDAQRIIKDVNKTAVVDGSGLKNTLERMAINNLDQKISLKDKKVLMVCALDRFGMAEAFNEAKAQLIFGDLIFALGLNIPLKSLTALNNVAKIIMPVVSRLPIKLLYPTGNKQDDIKDKYSKYYQWADIIAGDFHYIRRYLPENIEGKIIVTNTVTSDDLNLLASRGVSKLMITTPEFEGRSFGTNVLEAVLLSLLDKPLKEIRVSHYLKLLQKIDFSPQVIDFKEKNIV